MCGQPWACASVGPSGNRRRNHSATAGWKPSTAAWPAWPIGGASSGAVSWVISLIVPRGYDAYLERWVRNLAQSAVFRPIAAETSAAARRRVVGFARGPGRAVADRYDLVIVGMGS